MSNVLQIVTFPCTDAFVADKVGLLGPALADGLKSPGCLKNYVSLQVEQEDGKPVGCVAALWGSLEARQAVMAIPQHKELAQKAFGAAIAGTPNLRHVQHLNGAVDDVFAAPITEITTIKLKEGGNLDALREQFAALGKELSASASGVAWGELVEQPDTLVALLGWSTVDAHIKAATAEEPTKIRTAIAALSDVDIKHYHFEK